MAREMMYYFEHYPHHSGTMNSKERVDIAKVDAAYEARRIDDEEAEEDFYENVSGYAWNEILREWPSIRKSLERKGEWSGMWEEGSHALSMNSLKAAAHSVGLIEARIAVEEFEDEGDW